MFTDICNTFQQIAIDKVENKQLAEDLIINKQGLLKSTKPINNKYNTNIAML